MDEYKLITTKDNLSTDELIIKYNDAVETIWYLRHRLAELDKDYDVLACAYEEVSNQLYG